MSNGGGAKASTVALMSFNFISAVFIVFVNKILIETYHFKYSTFITCCHFVATFVGILLCEKANMFTHKQLKHLDVLPITLAFCGFVVFNNLSLQYNSIGFYQLMKVMTTPVIVCIEYFLYGIRQNTKLNLTLVPVIIGVALATVTDVSFNVVGTFWAVAGILATSFYQIFVKSKQDSLGANSFQVLKYQAPQGAVIVLFFVPLFDDVFGPDGLMNFMMNTNQNDSSSSSRPSFQATMIVLCISSILAFCVNLSIFLVVGRTDPVAYNVLGHFKLLVILTGGLLFFNGDYNPIRLFGMVLAFAGITWYTHLKQYTGNAWDEKKRKEERSSSSTNNNSNSKV